jgi:hypothetical protein
MPAKMGRPTKYSEELALAFLDEIARGSSIRKLTAKPEWPSDTTIHRWLQENEDFREQYRVARELQADMLADEVIPLAARAQQTDRIRRIGMLLG